MVPELKDGMIKMDTSNENMYDWSYDEIAEHASNLEKARKLSAAKHRQILECTDIEQVIELTYGKRGTPSREAYEEECEEGLRGE